MMQRESTLSGSSGPKANTDKQFESKCQDLLALWDQEFLNTIPKVIEGLETQTEQVNDVIENIKKKFMEKNQGLIEDLITYLKDFQQEFDHLIQKDRSAKKVVFIGNTGGGKTTVIHYLKHDRVERILDENQKPKIIVAGCNRMVIGNNRFQSMTSSCEFYQCEDIIYIDCPGFNDSHGLAQEIKNAYYMKALSGLSQVRLVLVVDDSEIKATKGKLLKELLGILRTMFDFEKIKDSISLIITKGQENISEYVSCLKDFYRDEENHEYYESAKIFASEEMEKKIAVFPLIKEFGEVSHQWHESITNAINASQPNEFEFRLSLSPAAQNSIQKLVNVLKNYGLWLLDQKIEAKNDRIKKNIAENKYLSWSTNDVKAQLKGEFNISTNSLEDFISGLGRFSEDDNVENSDSLKVSDFLKTTASCLQFLSGLNRDAEFKLEDWSSPFIQMGSIYQEFASDVKYQFEDNNSLLRVQAPIITTSELRKFLQPSVINEIRSIFLVSYLLIIDEDLDLPGIDMHLLTYYLQTYEEKTLSLKGRDGTSNERDGGNAGSLYGFAKVFSKNKVTIDTSGGHGYNGSYKIDEYLQRQLDELQLAIKDNERKLTPLKEIQKRKNELEQEQKSTLENGLNKTLRDLINQSLSYKSDLKDFEKKKSKTKERNIQAQAQEFQEKEKKFWNEVDNMKVGDDFSIYQKSVDDALNKFKAQIESLLIPSEICQEEEKLKQKFEKQHQIDIDGHNHLISIQELQTLDKTVQDKENELKDQKDKAQKNENALKKIKDKLQNFEKEVKDIRTKKENLEKVRESLSGEDKNIVPGPDHLRATFQQHYREITENLKKYEQAEKAYENIVVQKDSTILGSTEDLQKKTGGELLTFKPDKGQFLETCQAEKCKIEKMLKQTQSSVSSQSLSRKEKDKALTLLKDFQRYKLQKEVVQLKTDLKINTPFQSIKTEKVIHLLGNYIQKFVKKLRRKETGLLGGLKEKTKALIKKASPEKSFNLLKIIYETNLNEKFLNSKIDRLKNKLEYANSYINNLSTVISNSETIEFDFILRRKQYEEWKKEFEKTIQKRSDIKKLIDDFDQVIDPDFDEARDLLAYSHDLFRQEVNLVTRVERTWEDRDFDEKFSYVLKELLFFNTQYKERYELKGEQGGKGGNCGVIEFNTESVNPVCNIGKGGQSSYSFEGVYLSEKIFVGLRNMLGVSTVQELNEERASGSAEGYVKSFTSGIMATGAAAIAKNTSEAVFGFMAGAGFGLIALQILLSPIAAFASSQWLEGPFKIKLEDGQDGKQIERKYVDQEFSSLDGYIEKFGKFMNVQCSENSDPLNTE